MKLILVWLLELQNILISIALDMYEIVAFFFLNRMFGNSSILVHDVILSHNCFHDMYELS